VILIKINLKRMSNDLVLMLLQLAEKCKKQKE